MSSFAAMAILPRRQRTVITDEGPRTKRCANDLLDDDLRRRSYGWSADL
jgi:hypothetical protein